MPPSEHMWDRSGKHENNYLLHRTDPAHRHACIRPAQISPHQERSFLKSATVQQGVIKTAHMRSMLIPVFFFQFRSSFTLDKVQDANW